MNLPADAWWPPWEVRRHPIALLLVTQSYNHTKKIILNLNSLLLLLVSQSYNHNFFFHLKPELSKTAYVKNDVIPAILAMLWLLGYGCYDSTVTRTPAARIGTLIFAPSEGDLYRHWARHFEIQERWEKVTEPTYKSATFLSQLCICICNTFPA